MIEADGKDKFSLFLLGVIAHSLIVCSDAGRRFAYRFGEQIIGRHRLCESCGMKASPMHVLRHTAATWLVMDGMLLSEVAGLPGDREKRSRQFKEKHPPDYFRRAANFLKLGLKNKPVFQL